VLSASPPTFGSAPSVEMAAGQGRGLVGIQAPSSTSPLPSDVGPVGSGQASKATLREFDSRRVHFLSLISALSPPSDRNSTIAPALIAQRKRLTVATGDPERPFRKGEVPGFESPVGAVVGGGHWGLADLKPHCTRFPPARPGRLGPPN
jgi:hypothetical protein